MLKKIQIFKALDIEIKKQRGPSTVKRPYKDHKSLKEELGQPGVSIIAEIAGGNPLHGRVRQAFRPSTHAKTLLENGATALSVATDRFLYAGEDKHLPEVRAIAQCPLIRRDFIFEEYQIEESKILGSDAIYLTVALLEPERMKALHSLAKSKNLDVVFEVASQSDLDFALETEAQIICVVGRNLDTWEASREIAIDLLKKIPPKKCLKMVEAGVASLKQIKEFEALGVHGVIIGDVLLPEFYPGKRLAQLLSGIEPPRKPIKKAPTPPGASAEIKSGKKEVKGAAPAKQVKDAKETKSVKDTKAAKTAKVAVVAKATKKTKGSNEVKGAAPQAKQVKGAKETKSAKDTKAAKTAKTAKTAKVAVAAKATKKTKGANEVKGVAPAKQVKGAKETKSAKDTKAAKVAVVAKVTKKTKGANEVKGAAPQAKQVNGAKETKSAKDTKAAKVAVAAKATKETKGAMGDKNAKGAKIANKVNIVKGAKAAVGKPLKTIMSTPPFSQRPSGDIKEKSMVQTKKTEKVTAATEQNKKAEASKKAPAVKKAVVPKKAAPAAKKAAPKTAAKPAAKKAAKTVVKKAVAPKKAAPAKKNGGSCKKPVKK